MNAQTTKRMKILLADDGSQHAQATVRLLKDLPLPPKSRVHVLRAFLTGQIDILTQMEQGLKHTIDQLHESGIRANSELLLGYPAETIVKKATEMKPDLIVIGAKGLRATLGILLGGVAQQVVEYACCPVQVVRAPYHGIKHILLATDGSLYSQRAARYLSRFPIPEKTEIGVIHTLAPAPIPVSSPAYLGGWHDVPYPVHTPEEKADALEKQEKEGQALLDRACNLLLKKGIESTPVLLRGDAATEIIEYSDKEAVDLIVAGSRGLSSFQGWLMGSVSRKLVHYSNCSVLIVKQPEKE